MVFNALLELKKNVFSLAAHKKFNENYVKVG